jgi:hypothetical protein
MGMVTMKKETEDKRLKWFITPWQISSKGKWDGESPWIVVEGRIPFKALHIKEYIKELENLAEDKDLAPGNFYTCIGQLKDALRNNWKD